MKPVTEDQVQSLLNGLERREKEALRALAEKSADPKRTGGRLTGKVFGFRVTSKSKGAETSEGVVEFQPRRKEKLRRVTSRGFFLYSAVARGASQTN